MIGKKAPLALGLLLVLLLTLTALPIAAQDIVTPLGIGQNLTSAIQDPALGQLFRLETDMPQAVTLQLASQTAGFAPRFRLLDGNGLVVQTVENPAGLPLLDRQLPLSTSNLYLEVGSANGVIGSYTVALLPSAFATGPTPLALGQSVSGSVDSTTPEIMYSFEAPGDQPARLLVDSQTANRGVVVSLRDALTGELLGLNNMRFGGVDFDILPASGAFLVEIMHTGSEAGDAFTLCYTSADSASCAEASAPLACAVTPSGAPVNIRTGASTNFAILATLPAGANATVLGRNAAGSWMQIDYNGLNGWVAASVVTASGDCAGTPVVATPPEPVAPPAVETQAPPQNTPETPAPQPDNGGQEQPNDGGNGGGGNGGGNIPLGPGDISNGDGLGPDPTAPAPEFDIVLPDNDPTPEPPVLNLGFSN